MNAHKSKMLTTRCRITMMAGLLIAATAATAATKPPPRPADLPGVRVSPIRALPVAFTPDGVIPTGNWINLTDGPYQAGILFNCYDAFSIENNDCGTNGAWYMGEDYCNTFAVADMSPENACQNTCSEHVAFSWFWYVNGAGSSEQCFVGIFTGDQFSEDCQDPPYTLTNGVVYDFGVLDSSSGLGFYFGDVDLSGSGLCHEIPPAVGAYSMILAKDFDGQNFSFATCAQPMLWSANGTTNGVERAGSNGPTQSDDDNPHDGQHTLPDECYDYAFGQCPDPLTIMAGFDSGPQACNGREAIQKIRCRRNMKITVRLDGGRTGDTFLVELDTGEIKTGTLDDSGKGKARFKHIAPGRNHANARWGCGAEDRAAFDCS